jgi:hypothetical protein
MSWKFASDRNHRVGLSFRAGVALPGKKWLPVEAAWVKRAFGVSSPRKPFWFDMVIGLGGHSVELNERIPKTVFGMW